MKTSSRGRCCRAAIALVFLAAAAHAASFPAARGAGGAVATAEVDATAAGLEILRAGGNAVDAVIASALALAVVHPQAGNLGGGGFAVVRMGNELVTLDFREVAPAAAGRDMYLDASGERRPDASTLGPLAAGVPGTPTGLHLLHARLGSLPWRDVVEPARTLAGDGFRVTRRLHESIDNRSDLLATFPETAKVWLPNGAPPPIGSTKRLPLLADTLAAYAVDGPAALTRGPVAERVVAVSRRHGGILTAEDLAAYRPEWRRPIRFEAFGWRFASMDQPSSGGIILAQVFGLLERLGWAELEPGGADWFHLVAEAWRQAFVDRLLLGDPSSSDASAAELLAPARLDRLARELPRDRARESRSMVALGAPPAESAETTHLSVIDRDGNAVALTTTLNGSFGSKLWVPGFGFLNNEMDDFTTAPGRPNLYGLVQGEANTIAPGRRMLSSMSPTIAWRGDERFVFGGQGGSKIPTASSWVALGALVDGLPLQAAVDRPRIHHQWLPDAIQTESDSLSPETRAALVARGHAVVPVDFTAKVCVARRLASGLFEAAGDPRGPDAGGVVDPQ